MRGSATARGEGVTAADNSRGYGHGALRRRLTAMVLLAVAVSNPVTATPPADSCVAQGDVTPLCGFQRPEDLEVIAGTHLLVSEYGSLGGSRTGRLVLFDPVSRNKRVLYPPAEPGAGGEKTVWSDPDCPGAPGAAFSPHGIHHSVIGGPERVLVVNHGGREAVELFEIVNADDPDTLALVWRGCVVAPTTTWMNDVVGLPEGALAVSHMITRGTAEEALLEAEQRRADIGRVLEWQPEVGWRRLAGSDGALPNGLEISADGEVIYVNEYFGNRVVALERDGGKRRWVAEVASPDNSSWAADGRLLVASHREPLAAVIACNKHADRNCPLPYAIVALDPLGGESTILIEGGDEAMGGATVAVQIGEALYLGSFVGDRIARVELPAPASTDLVP
ncbi:MAG TPA: hypothetical protein QF901_00870 [Gammaproteobacteria bacterium]|jgi:sugar lactone lactonase YvrE|nr:hypothetical protein [Gammaproteobacteria bacterium]